ncbi:MAG: hypothetical protein KC423_12565 [Anaerolineales bacterium]|nr:hypothetical protein [Anaerolineales bacterium]
MSDTVLIVLIIVVAIIIVLWLFRSSLSRFFIKANKEGMEAELQTHSSQKPGAKNMPTTSSAKASDVNVSGNWQIGRGNKIRTSGKSANVSDNRQLGEEQEITVEKAKQRKKK